MNRDSPTTQQFSFRDNRPGTLHAHAFCRVGLRPSSAPRPPRSWPLLPSKCFQKGLERGRSSPSAASHRASANWERTRHPLPLFTQYDEGRKIRAGDISCVSDINYVFSYLQYDKRNNLKKEARTFQNFKANVRLDFKMRDGRSEKAPSMRESVHVLSI